MGVSTQVLDPDLGVTMVKVETGGSMDVKVNSMMMVTSPLRPNLTWAHPNELLLVLAWSKCLFYKTSFSKLEQATPTLIQTEK